ncbi:N-6 DNA methylase [Rothia sp. CCM 9416]|uniref:N-6 DNA methylase n=1 Tax=Rothia sp. CCM 9416 TaxID=3402655 RepID=UPI003AE37A13
MPTEDTVRNNAGKILGFDEIEAEVVQGTGQITTFNQLGFRKVADKPDGWYLPKNKTLPAIILEAKSSSVDIGRQEWVDELKKNVNIALTKYEKCVGILYNHEEIRVFLNNIELDSVSSTLERKEYYIKLATNKPIDKMRIYVLTSRINNSLHFKFGIKDLYQRMIFTACALVALREGALISRGMDFSLFHTSILNQLNKSLVASKVKNFKLTILSEEFSKIQMNYPDNQEAIDDFIGWVKDISELVNSDNWAGEDVMAIFFNEFNRYRGKSEHGQVFTPDHITGFMSRLIDLNEDDRVLDAACGSGAFLVKAMNIMIEKSGGVNTKKAAEIKKEQLYGIELDRQIFALAAANMLIHKDGKTNLEQLDTQTAAASTWISERDITKVLMNPPFERKYGCIKIVKNVLDSVPRGTKSAFILPDKKLEKDGGKGLLKKHRLEKIIKLPEGTFPGIGMTTSIFIFTAKEEHGDREIFACNIEEDGLVTIKNQGRQDIHNKWSAIEDRWLDIIRKQSGHASIQWIDPKKHLSWQAPKKEFEIFETDIFKHLSNYELYKQGRDARELQIKLGQLSLYNEKFPAILESIGKIKNSSRASVEKLNNSNWSEFKISDYFEVSPPEVRSVNNYDNGDMPFVSTSDFNNGVVSYLSPHDDDDFEQGGCITVSPLTGASFYQSKNFLARGGAGSSISILRRVGLTEESALFICSVIEATSKQFGYTDQLSKSKLRNLEIKLPKNSQGDPDWEYMGEYIKKLQKNVSAHLENINEALRIISL